MFNGAGRGRSALECTAHFFRLDENYFARNFGWSHRAMRTTKVGGIGIACRAGGAGGGKGRKIFFSGDARMQRPV